MLLGLTMNSFFGNNMKHFYFNYCWFEIWIYLKWWVDPSPDDSLLVGNSVSWYYHNWPPICNYNTMPLIMLLKCLCRDGTKLYMWVDINVINHPFVMAHGIFNLMCTEKDVMIITFYKGIFLLGIEMGI